MSVSIASLVRCVAHLATVLAVVCVLPQAAGAEDRVDFNHDIRPLLSDRCYKCHGPDAKERKGGIDGLRLDTRAGALENLGDYAAIVPGAAQKSELVRRINAADADELMPPADSGKMLSSAERKLLTRWVEEGAEYAPHWSYVKPVRPALPQVQDQSWPKSEIDFFLLASLERAGLTPAPEADRYALIRRASLDLCGLPPSLEEVDQFVADERPDAYERLVDRLLDKRAYGEHWARMWLDLARYADSAGYADDPPRTIWAFRDYMIQSLNGNVPLDRLTIEQLAGDLLPYPSEQQLVASAFHRNTLTNNEGGTNDEEFRTVAVVDRVNTTLAVWMGTTIACAQCHNHKYDPLSQEEFFRLFAVFNNTEDADRPNEGPLLTIYSDEQQEQKARWQTEIEQLQQQLQAVTPELAAAQARWEERFAAEVSWATLVPREAATKSDADASIADDGSVDFGSKGKTDVYTLTIPLSGSRIEALTVEALPEDALPGGGPGHADGKFIVSRIAVTIAPPDAAQPKGRYVRVEIPGAQKILSLAEVQVFAKGENIAAAGEASQSSIDYEGPAQLAIDGKTSGDYAAKSVTHTAVSDNPWWELDLKRSQAIDRIVLWNRTDNGHHTRLAEFRVIVLDEHRETVWKEEVAKAPNPSAEYATSGSASVHFTTALAEPSVNGFDPAHVIVNPDVANKGWGNGEVVGQEHALTLIPAEPITAAEGAVLTLTIEQVSRHPRHTIGRLRILASDDSRAAEYARIPAGIRAILKAPAADRTAAQRQELSRHYLTIAPELKEPRQRLAALEKQLAELKPYATVPVMRELPADKARKTRIQFRGNFLDLGPEVTPGVPAIFPPLPDGQSADRLALARWLMSEENPLTARVIVNRYWEQIFGTGIVRTSEEFGSQGELPSHPELLDWLATELVRRRWDVKQLVRLLVTSAAYRQSSRLSPELAERDPDNRLLARGPRFRLSAEMVRDQALAAAGLLSPKMYGPPVRPPQPSLGLNAAFGGAVDWQSSAGEDRWRRGLYTSWRRSSPYPSMAAFDAPNREVCTLNRARTNTPLQALVTLNDPVYVEAAQALARRIAASGTTSQERAAYGFRLCLARPPSESELALLVRLYDEAIHRFADDTAKAQQLATDPLGPAPDGAKFQELAAWTVVANVLLNLDEMMMKR